LPRLSNPLRQAVTLSNLALGYVLSGQPEYASRFYRRNLTIRSELKNTEGVSTVLCNLSDSLRSSGALHESETTVRGALVITREQQDHYQEAVSLYWLGLVLTIRGVADESNLALQRSLRMFASMSENQAVGYATSFLARRALWLSQFASALSLANRAWELAQADKLEGDVIRAAGAQGQAALGLNEFAAAEERLHHALTRARAVNFVDEELPALVALAELSRRQHNPKAAREFLDDLWELAGRGPYPLIHADALNVLAQIERDAGNTEAAIEAATKAYRLAWCDGPPFAYHWGLVAARKHLQELGAPEPEMPPFDPSKFEPMPEVEIDPDDEFHFGKDTDD